MNGLIGRKVGMTSVYDERGKNIACTIVDASSNVITQIKTEETDGYNAIQLGFGEAKEKNTSRAMQGHFKKANTPIKRKLVEFRDSPMRGKTLGESVNVDEVFQVGDYVDVIGISKGKGFQGVVKRHGFAGVGDATHGQHNRMRAPGSIGASSFPSKVVKGMKMGGRMGGKRVKLLNLEVVKIFPDNNLLVIKGCIPGHKGGYVIIEK